MFNTNRGGKITSPGKKPIPPDELKNWMRRIERKIDVLVDTIEKRQKPRKAGDDEIGEPLDVITLLSLPDHLRKSALTIVKLGKAMAEDVAAETGRARAIESAYLNQLVRMGHLSRKREGKRVYFWAEAGSAKIETSKSRKGASA